VKYIEIDFYKAFDGDDGIILSINTEHCSKKIVIWDGFYRDIIDRLKPIDDGVPCLVYYYDKVMDFNNKDKVCQISNLDKILFELQNIKLLPDNRTDQIYYNAEYRVLSEIIDMITEAIDKKISVYIQAI
jgi:hypothetical protein